MTWVIILANKYLGIFITPVFPVVVKGILDKMIEGQKVYCNIHRVKIKSKISYSLNNTYGGYAVLSLTNSTQNHKLISLKSKPHLNNWINLIN